MERVLLNGLVVKYTRAIISKTRSMDQANSYTKMEHFIKEIGILESSMERELKRKKQVKVFWSSGMIIN